jgi:hypothetical protein
MHHPPIHPPLPAFCPAAASADKPLWHMNHESKTLHCLKKIYAPFHCGPERIFKKHGQQRIKKLYFAKPDQAVAESGKRVILNLSH